MSGDNNIITMQIALPPDAAGFIGFECPECLHYFKVVDATMHSAWVYCTYCGLGDESEKFLTAEEVDYIKRVGAGKAIGQLKDQCQDKLVKAFRNSKVVKVTRSRSSPPSAPPRPMERQLPNQNTCTACALIYAFESDATVCPQCNTPVS